MTTPETGPFANQTETPGSPERTADLYAIQLALTYFINRNRKFARIVEEVMPETGHLSRKIDWTCEMPTITDIFGDMALDDPPRNWIVPLWPFRHGALLSNLAIESQHSQATVLSHSRSMSLSEKLLAYEWGLFLASIEGRRPNSPETEQITKNNISAIVSGTNGDSSLRVFELVSSGEAEIVAVFGTGSTKADVTPGELAARKRLARVQAVAEFLSLRYFIWIETNCPPGEILELCYRYRTPYSPTFASQGRLDNIAEGIRARFATMYDYLNIFFIKHPRTTLIPVSRSYISHTYSVVCDAPPGNFFSRFELARFQNGRYESIDLTGDSLGAKASVEGQCGGHYGQINTQDLSSVNREGVYVVCRSMETPPGTLGTASNLLFLCFVMNMAVTLGRRFITSANISAFLSLNAVIFGLVTAWLVYAFGHSENRNIPLITRTIIAWTAFVAISTLLLVIADSPPSHVTIGGYNSQSLYKAYTIITLTLLLVAWIMRFHCFRQYVRNSKRSYRIYGY